MSTLKFTGKMSIFGGPQDIGVGADEGLAFIEPPDLAQWKFNHLFLPDQPIQTSGLARRLNPMAWYIALRIDKNVIPRQIVRNSFAIVSANGLSVAAQVADWGPNEDTGRVADLSPGIASTLGLSTNDEVTVDLYYPTSP